MSYWKIWATATTVGKALMQLANPGAIRFIRIDAGNTVTALSDTDMRAALALALGLPMWTYTAGSMAAGAMKTNNAACNSTTSIDFSVTTKNGGATFLTFLTGIPIASVVKMHLTDSIGRTVVFAITSVTNNTTYVTLGVSVVGSSGLSWSGDYQVAFVPGASPDMTAVQLQSSITPCADATVNPVTSITTVQGIITAIS